MIGKDELLAWLTSLDKKLTKSITLVAVGGTAMTLLGLKSSTIDVDFCLSKEDKKIFEKILDKKFRTDIFIDGYIFSEQLPPDYSKKAKDIREFSHIQLKALHPADIIITKAARLNARDEEDISALARLVDKNELLSRFEQVAGTFAGDENQYRYHMDVVLRRFFK